MEDSAEYSVEVKNQYGEAYSFATVLVRSKYKYSSGFKLSNTAESSKYFHYLMKALWKRIEQLLFLSHFWAQPKFFFSDSIWIQLSFHWDKNVLNLGAYFFWTAMKQPHSETHNRLTKSLLKIDKKWFPKNCGTSQSIIAENATIFP